MLRSMHNAFSHATLEDGKDSTHSETAKTSMHDDALSVVGLVCLLSLMRSCPIAQNVPYSAEPVLQSVMRCHQRAVEPYAVGLYAVVAQPTMPCMSKWRRKRLGERPPHPRRLSTGAFSERWRNVDGAQSNGWGESSQHCQIWLQTGICKPPIAPAALAPMYRRVSADEFTPAAHENLPFLCGQ
jgi:hypothetical protein